MREERELIELLKAPYWQKFLLLWADFVEQN